MSWDEAQGRKGFAGDLFKLRRRLKGWPSQSAFAEKFGLSFGMVKDAEQSRTRPSRAFRVLVAAIELDPGLIERAAAEAKRRGWD